MALKLVYHHKLGDQLSNSLWLLMM